MGNVLRAICKYVCLPLPEGIEIVVGMMEYVGEIERQGRSALIHHSNIMNTYIWVVCDPVWI